MGGHIVKRAIHLFSLIIYPALMLYIEATSFAFLFWRGKGTGYSAVEMCMIHAGMFAAHYFIFIITRDKTPGKFYMHLLGCTYLLGVEVLYALFMSILCFCIPSIIIFQIVVVAVRSFYIARQWRRYKRLREVTV